MTDNIFEIETSALAHVACAPQESGVLLTDFLLLRIPVSIIPGFSQSLNILVCLIFSAASYEASTKTALHMWNLREQNEDNS